MLNIKIEIMEELLNNIESAIHSQVIEKGECVDDYMYFEDYELEMGGEIYYSTFFIYTIKGDGPEPNKYLIQIKSVDICMSDEIKPLYPEMDVFTISLN